MKFEMTVRVRSGEVNWDCPYGQDGEDCEAHINELAIDIGRLDAVSNTSVNDCVITIEADVSSEQELKDLMIEHMREHICCVAFVSLKIV